LKFGYSGKNADLQGAFLSIFNDEATRQKRGLPFGKPARTILLRLKRGPWPCPIGTAMIDSDLQGY
jgi:hypothetical protein